MMEIDYTLRADETVPFGIKRIVSEQIGGAVSELRHEAGDLESRIHQTRRHLKQIRAVFRLIKNELGFTGALENEFVRDVARELSELRDAQAIVVAVDRVAKSIGSNSVALDAFSSVKRTLVERRDAVTSSAASVDKARVAAAQLEAFSSRVVDWPLESDGFGALGPGLVGMYARARKEMGRALLNPGSENLHDWRKRVKDHWYHLRLLAPMWNDVLRDRQKRLKALSDALGDHHDLDVIVTIVASQNERARDEKEIVLELLKARQLELEQEARNLAGSIFETSAENFGILAQDCWTAWRPRSEIREQEGSDEKKPWQSEIAEYQKRPALSREVM